jgi:hypothetical protein
MWMTDAPLSGLGFFSFANGPFALQPLVIDPFITFTSDRLGHRRGNAS